MAEKKPAKSSSGNTRARTGASSGASSRKKTSRAPSRSRRKSSVSSPVLYEIRDICVIIALVLLNLCMFLHARMGVIGRGLYAFSVGLFGFSAFLISLYLLGVAVLWVAGRLAENRAKVLAVLGVILGLSVLLYIINGNLSLHSFSEQYKAATIANGGAFGGLIAVFLVRLIGRVGSLVVVLLILLVTIVIVTEKSITKGIGLAATHTAQEVRTRHEEHLRTREERRAEREQLLEAKRREDEQAAYRARSLARQEIDASPSYEVNQPEVDPATTRTEKTNGKAKAQPAQRVSEGEDGDMLDLPLFDSEYDFYLAKKRQHQKNGGAASEKKTEKKTEPVINTPSVKKKPAAKKVEEADVLPYEDILPYEKEEDPIQINIADTSYEKPSYEEPSYEEPPYDEPYDEIPVTETLPSKKTVTRKEAVAQEGEESFELEGEPDLSGKPQLKEYVFPSLELLHPGSGEEGGESRDDLLRNARILESSLASFGVEAKVLQVNKGPAVTRYELQPSEGVRVSRIMNLADDIALNLATSGIRIEGPIPGKKALGIEVPNKETTSVNLRDVIDSDKFRKMTSPLAFALGKDIDGNVQVTDIARMPHLLIAGATGSGKSVCINCLLMSIIYKAKPEDVGLILIDPKVVELSVYNGIPHLLTPVVTDPKKAALSLNWAVQEMTKRYKQFSDAQVRDIKGFNEWVESNPDCGQPRMKRIIIVVDELADLMMVASKEVEDSICRLAQMARAAGLHLVIATQRPSVDVITGLIKANIPSRLAFAVSSGVDSRTILDMVGAEKLLGRGDMLFAPIGASKPIRIQGAFVSDHEVEDVVAAIKQEVTATNQDLEDTMRGSVSSGGAGAEDDDLDEYLEQAIQYVVDKQKASISMLQRVFRIGFNRAARLMDALEERGIVGPDEGSKPRKVLMTSEELQADGEE